MADGDSLERLKTALRDRCYTIERELGSGGMATVYLAHDLKHDRKIAVKVLRPELAASIGAERFLREIKIAANLNHPHILPLHDSGEADGLLYYIMPFVEGESLRDRLNRERQLPVDDALRITGEVADALGFAHSHGIVHRDIKPENILLEGGHAAVRRLDQRIEDWHGLHLEEVLTNVRGRAWSAVTMVRFGRLAEARHIIEQLLAEDPQHIGFRGYLGVIAAHMGDMETADAITTELRIGTTIFVRESLRLARAHRSSAR